MPGSFISGGIGGGGVGALVTHCIALERGPP